VGAGKKQTGESVLEGLRTRRTFSFNSKRKREERGRGEERGEEEEEEEGEERKESEEIQRKQHIILLMPF
jgi:hypothetical protein